MPQGAQTADRVIQLLVLAAGSEEPISSSELGERAGLNRATTYRLVQSLVAHDMLARDPRGRGYVLGSGLVALAGMVMRKVRLGETARPTMERIAQETSETVSLHIRHLRQRVCIATVESPLPVRRVVPLGETLPLWAGTSGKMMLAFMGDDEVAEILEAAAEEGADPASIRDQIASGRRAGGLWAVSDRTPGVGGLTVPVFTAAGIAAAMTVSGPSSRFGMAQMSACAPAVMRECAALSRALGYGEEIPGAPVAG